MTDQIIIAERRRAFIRLLECQARQLSAELNTKSTDAKLRTSVLPTAEGVTLEIRKNSGGTCRISVTHGSRLQVEMPWKKASEPEKPLVYQIQYEAGRVKVFEAGRVVETQEIIRRIFGGLAIFVPTEFEI